MLRAAINLYKTFTSILYHSKVFKVYIKDRLYLNMKVQKRATFSGVLFLLPLARGCLPKTLR